MNFIETNMFGRGHNVLDLDVWKVGLAAWVFAGYCPLKLKEAGKIIRLSDNSELSNGTKEFSEAKQLRQPILTLLKQKISECIGIPIVDRDHFPRNWLIDMFVNHWNVDECFDIWWIDAAITKRFVPAYVKRQLLPRSILAMGYVKGYRTYVHPSKPQKVIKDPRSIPKNTASSANEHKILFQRTSIQPQSEFYVWLVDKIASLQQAIPEPQFKGLPPIEGWSGHCEPRPTAKIVRDMIKDDEEWEIRELHPPDAFEYSKDDSEKKILTMHALKERLYSWFEATEEGLEFEDHLNLHSENNRTNQSVRSS